MPEAILTFLVVFVLVCQVLEPWRIKGSTGRVNNAYDGKH